MRIISKSHDYYDSVQALGQDRTLLYLREPKAVPGYPYLRIHPHSQVMQAKGFPMLRDVDYSFYDHRGGSSNIATGERMVGFCGKIYPALHLTDARPGCQQHAAWCFSLADVDAFILDRFGDKVFQSYAKDSSYRHDRRALWPRDKKQHIFEQHFAACAQQQSAFRHLFEEHASPAFVAGRQEGSAEKAVVYNACLKDVEFYRVFDPYRAFQEIAMFLGGLATPHKPIPHIDDETMAQAKGFTDPYCFRKEPRNR